MIETTYPELCQMFGGYMHQDWTDDYIWDEGEKLDFRVTIKAYKEDCRKKPEFVSTAITELENLIDKHYTNATLDDVFDELGIDVDPEAFYLSHQQFLIEVLNELKK